MDYHVAPVLVHTLNIRPFWTRRMLDTLIYDDYLLAIPIDEVSPIVHVITVGEQFLQVWIELGQSRLGRYCNRFAIVLPAIAFPNT